MANDNVSALLALMGGDGGGGGGSSNAVLYTAQTLTEAQKEQARENIGAGAAENTVTISETTPTITPAANTTYQCGELTSLTISNPPTTGAYSIVFTSGSTATTTTFPSTILGLEDFAAEANTIYEINVMGNLAVVGKWAVTA